MPVISIAQLLEKFGPGDAPRSDDYIDLIDTLADDRNAVYFDSAEPADTAANPLWFNTSTNELSVYSGGQWNGIAGSSDISANSPLSYNSETGELSIDLSAYDTSSEVDTKLSNYDTSSEVDTKLSNYDTSAEVDTKLSDYDTSVQVDTKLSDYDTSSEVDTKLSNYDTSSEVDTKLSGYYDSSEVDNLFSTLITKVPTGTTAPATTEVGALWYNSSDGSLYVYFDGFWVEVI